MGICSFFICDYVVIFYNIIGTKVFFSILTKYSSYKAIVYVFFYNLNPSIKVRTILFKIVPWKKREIYMSCKLKRFLLWLCNFTKY